MFAAATVNQSSGVPDPKGNRHKKFSRATWSLNTLRWGKRRPEANNANGENSRASLISHKPISIILASLSYPMRPISRIAPL